MRVEQLDDLPILGDQIFQMDLSTHLDSYFPDHGHWQGISGGKLAVGWLLYILSESDHRLSYVEEWASRRLESLKVILDEPSLRKVDFCDDRLGRLLDRYSDDDAWANFEQSLGKTMLEVYSLDSDSRESGISVVRSDSFNVPQYREPGDLFGYGYSKQRRKDQPFCKVMLASLDPLSLPMAVEIVKGSGPDSVHYLSVINRVQSIFGKSGNLYVGDSQLGSMANRISILQSKDYYLCPLNRKQCVEELLYQYLDHIDQPVNELPGIFTEPDAKRKPAYFYQIKETLTDQAQSLAWEERRILVYSPDYAQGLLGSFENRLQEAKEAIENLVVGKKGRRNPKTLQQLYTRIDRIIKKYKVEDCFEITCTEQVEKYLVRKHKDRPDEIREKITLTLKITRDDKIVELKRKRLGWQIYASNVPEDKISTADLVTCYRNEYRIEHLFDKIINRDVGLLPVFLKKEKRILALIRFLSLAMRFSIWIQHKIREELAKNNDTLKGIYPGNKNRSTHRPTTEMMLRAFRAIALVWVKVNDQEFIQMTSLNQTQKKILTLLGAKMVYERIFDFLNTYPDLRET